MNDLLTLRKTPKKYGDPKRGQWADLYIDSLRAADPSKAQAMEEAETLELLAILVQEQAVERYADLVESGTPAQIAHSSERSRK